MAFLQIAFIFVILNLNWMSYGFSQDHGPPGFGGGRRPGPPPGLIPPGPSGPFPPGPGPQHHRGPPPPLAFLRNVTDQARREFFSIQMDPNMTKAEVKQKLGQWAEINGVKDQYANFTATIQQFDQKFHDLAVANLAGEALKLYNTLWDILQNDQITGAEECQQIQNAVNGTSANILGFVPPPPGPPKCHPPPPPHRHGRRPPFTSNFQSFEDNAGGDPFDEGPGGLGGDPQNSIESESNSQQHQ